MDAKEINAHFDLLSVVEKDTRLRKVAQNWYNRACPFCGGDDRFVLKQTSHGYRWLCRKCSDAKYHTPLDYLMRRDQVDFKTALRQAGGDVQSMPAPKPQPARPEYAAPDEDWQERARTAALEANKRLLYKADGERGRGYLAGWGISLAACDYWLLGYTVVADRPAITIPHLTFKQDILAVKYRFLDEQKPRFTARPGSEALLYGLFAATGGDALVVEGEFNAVAVWLCTVAGLDMILTGTQKLTDFVREALPRPPSYISGRWHGWTNPRRRI